MAEIKIYNNSVEGLRPDERAQDARIRAGREIDANYSAAGNFKRALGQELGSAIDAAGGAYVKFEQAREINEGAPAFMGQIVQTEKEWNDALRNNPNDPTIQQKLFESTETRLQEFRSSFHTEGGQRWAESRIDQFREHLRVKTTADLMAVETSKVKVSIDQVTNASSALAASSPADLKFLIKNYQETIAGIVDNSNLKGDIAVRVRGELMQAGLEKIVKSGVLSLTYKNPGAGEVLSKDPEIAKYVDGNEIRQVATMADRINKQEARAARMEAREAQTQRTNEALGAIVNSTIQDDGSLRVPSGAYIQLRDQAAKLKIEPGKVEQTVRFLKSVETASRRINTDPAIRDELDARITIAPGEEGALSVQDLALMRTQEVLSDADFRRYAAVLKAPSDPNKRGTDRDFSDAVKSFRSSITKSDPILGNADPEGDQRYGQFQQMARRAYEQVYRTEGEKAARGFFNLNDPNSGIRQLLPAVIGKSGASQAAQRIIRQTHEGVQTVPPLYPADDSLNRRPGESMEQYLKRRRGEK